MSNPRILFIGVGNPGRQDDGLGPLFVQKLESDFLTLGNSNIDFETKYQLQIEDAELFSHYDEVYIFDASIDESLTSFSLKVIQGSEQHPFSSHALNFQAVIFLAQDMFSFEGSVHLFSIKGFEFELIEELSIEAKRNFDLAYKYFLTQFNDGVMDD